jgi:carboxyl-terminal processing protease
MKRRFIVKTTTAITISVGLITNSGNFLSHQSLAQSPPNQPAAAVNSPKQLIDEVWQIVDRQYIDRTFNGQDWKAVRQQYLNRSYRSNEDEEAYKAIREMLERLGDPFTRFMSPEEFKLMQVDKSGDTAAVGVQLNLDNTTKELVITSPIEEAPAYTAGILPGDVLVKIDGQRTQGMNQSEAATRMRGKAGTIVVLTVRRGQKELEFRIPRQVVELRPVRYRTQQTTGGSIGYIRLNQFSANVSEEIRNAIRDLEQQRVTGYVLDLRSNPGGLFYASVEIARMWINQGVIVSTVDRQGVTDIQQANNRALTDKPLIVLINEGTASGSEILAAALQENLRAKLVGTQSRGYNSIQSVRGLGNGSGLAVTIAKWHTPKKQDIGSSGITPDVVVTLTQAQQATMIRERSAGTPADPQYAKAVEVLTQTMQSSQ